MNKILAVAIVIGVVGAIWSLYFFSRDFYMNISQAAGGGAPKAGIITIAEPCKAMAQSNVYYSIEEQEISKPCFLLNETDDSLLISEMFLEHENFASLNGRSIFNSVYRIDKNYVAQFSPISYFQMWRNGLATIMTNSLPADVIHHLEFSLVGVLIPTNSLAVAERQVDFQTQHMPEMFFWVDDWGCVSEKARSVSFATSDVTNLVGHINFSSIPCQRGIQIWQWENLITNSTHKVGFRIDNFPKAPTGFLWCRLIASFRCNFIYEIEVPFEKVIENETTCFAHKPLNQGLVEMNDKKKGGQK